MRQLPFEYAFRNLGRSGIRLATASGGAMLVTLLILASGGFVRGMQRTLTSASGLNENIILLGAGSEEAIERSEISASVASIATASVRGIKSRGGTPFVSPEIHIALPIRLDRSDEETKPAVFRGVRPEAFLVHSEVEITSGRMPTPGAEEILVGSLASTRLGVPSSRLEIGRTIHLDDRDWTVVGWFSAPNTVMDAEIWMPLSDLQIATRRESSVSCVILSLEEGTFADVSLFAMSRLDLEIVPVTERAYYASIASVYRPIRIMIVGTAALIAIAGVLGGLNTMYAAFASRVREVGMLQSLGFTRASVAWSLTEESVFIACCGGLVGCALGIMVLDGLAVRFSMGAFAVVLDPPVMLAGMGGALAVGVIGAVPPVIRCLRLPIPEALKSI